MTQQLNLKKEVDGEKGYSLQLQLTPADLETLRQLIRIQWLYRLQLIVPDQIKRFDELGMEFYHEVSHLFDHATVWPKYARVFPREIVTLIRKLDFFKQLESDLGPIHIADEENFGWENIYWRLVRPGNTDFGSIHADKWFWDIGEYGTLAHFPYERLKIWLPIYSVPTKNGLMVLPQSHTKKNWQWHIETHYGRKKPVFDEAETELENMVLLPLKPGESVVFHDELLHGGAPNLADTTRVSLEFTILIPQS